MTPRTTLCSVSATKWELRNNLGDFLIALATSDGIILAVGVSGISEEPEHTIVLHPDDSDSLSRFLIRHGNGSNGNNG